MEERQTLLKPILGQIAGDGGRRVERIREALGVRELVGNLRAGLLSRHYRVPRSMGVTFQGVRVFYPDLSVLLTTVGAVALFWAVTMPLLLKQRPTAAPEAG